LDACYVVRDNGGQKLTYVYYEDEPGRRSAARTLIWTVANLQQLENFNRPYLIGPCTLPNRG
jgi:hypothetical protein